LSTHTLIYGSAGTLALQIAPERLVAHCGASAAALTDPAAATRAALAAPLGFPPLAKAVTPGDHVAITLEDDVPREAEILATVIETVCQAGVLPCDITVLRTEEAISCDTRAPLALVADEMRAKVTLKTHDPTATKELAYLAATDDAEPIYLSRTVVDADVAIPIGCVRPHDTLEATGVHGGLWPAFASVGCRERFHQVSRRLHREDAAKQKKEADEIAWLLGVSFTVQVLPAGGDEVAAVLAGDPPTVWREGQRLCDKLWRDRPGRRADLVVAALSGGPYQQNWRHVARAVASARRVVNHDGMIALVTQVTERPSSSLLRLASGEPYEAILTQLDQDHGIESEAARELLMAEDTVRVFLLSELPAEHVEELGLAPVEDAADIARLAGRAESVILLSHAQYAAPTV